jgi:carbon monoxide dehydrogenase subunit G
MEAKLEKRYPLQVDAERAWTVLRDVRTVAGCMPGASLTEQIDDDHYRGSVKVNLGPVMATFGGNLEVVARDDGARRLQLRGKGADRSGSSAAMDMLAVIEPGNVPGACVLYGTSTVTVSGKFAQFGGRMINQVSDMILGQFVDNFRAAAAAQPGPEGAAVTAPPAAAGEIHGLAILWALIRSWFTRLLGRST